MEFIITTPHELESIILSSIRKVLEEQGSFNSEQTQDKLFSIKEASIFLNLASQTLYGFTSKREIPFLKRGKKLYFRKSELEKWLLEGRRKSKEEILNEMKK